MEEVRKEYICLIKKAKERNHIKVRGDGYEVHHILPKSMFPLWENRESNKVSLTYDEHVEAHRLLVEIYKNDKMLNAYKYMTKQLPHELMSKVAKERWKNEKYREKVVSSNKKTYSDKTSKGYNNWKKGIERFEEKRVNSLKKKISIKVKLVETGQIFESCEEAARFLGLKNGIHISECIRGGRQVAGKLPDGRKCHWELVSDNERRKRGTVPEEEKKTSGWKRFKNSYNN